MAIGVILTPSIALAQDDDEAKEQEKRAVEAERKSEEEAKDAELVARAKGVKLTFRLGVRFLSSAPFSKTYQNVLTAYGYNSLSALVEGAADVAWSPWRFIDLGVHTGYGFGDGGSTGGSGGTLTLHDLELGGFAYAIIGRNDLRRAGPFGVGVEGGAMFPFLVLRGDVESARIPYVGPVLLARLLGDARVQTAIHLRYVIANWSNAFAGGVGLPLGGFSISVGANLSL
jgi:hypothetical protein